MTLGEVEYIEKVRVREYEGYCPSNVILDFRKVLRALREMLEAQSEGETASTAKTADIENDSDP